MFGRSVGAPRSSVIWWPSTRPARRPRSRPRSRRRGSVRHDAPRIARLHVRGARERAQPGGEHVPERDPHLPDARRADPDPFPQARGRHRARVSRPPARDRVRGGGLRARARADRDVHAGVPRRRERRRRRRVAPDLAPPRRRAHRPHRARRRGGRARGGLDRALPRGRRAAARGRARDAPPLRRRVLPGLVAPDAGLRGGRRAPLPMARGALSRVRGEVRARARRGTGYGDPRRVLSPQRPDPRHGRAPDRLGVRGARRGRDRPRGADRRLGRVARSRALGLCRRALRRACARRVRPPRRRGPPLPRLPLAGRPALLDEPRQLRIRVPRAARHRSEDGAPAVRRLLRLLRYVRPHWRGLVGVLGTMGLSTAIGLLEPWPIKLFVDNVVGNKPWPHWLQDVLNILPGSDGKRGLLLWVAIATVFIFLLATLAGMLNSLVTTTVSQRMTLRLGGDLFAHLQKLSPLFHHRRPLGDTIARVTGDPSCVSILVIDGVVPLVHSVVLIAAMFSIIWALQSTLALIGLAVAPFLILSMKLFGGRMKHRSRSQRDYEGVMMNVVERTLSAIPVVQSFTREDVENRRYVETGNHLVRAYRRSIFMSMWFKLAIGTVTTVGTGAVLYVGGTYVLDGKMTAGSVLVFLAYLGALYDPLHSVTYTSSTLQYAAAQADRVMEIMETEIDPADSPDAVDMTLRGDIRFEDVSFAYEPDTPVLQH